MSIGTLDRPNWRVIVPLAAAIPLLVFFGPTWIHLADSATFALLVTAACSLVLLVNVDTEKLRKVLPDSVIDVLIRLATKTTQAINEAKAWWADVGGKRPEEKTRKVRRVSRVFGGPIRHVGDLQQLEENGEYERLIGRLRELLRKDPTLWTHPWVKNWCGLRWRNLFIRLAATDEQAVKTSTQRGLLSWFGFTDRRSAYQRVAMRFLKGNGPTEYVYVEGGSKTVPMPDYQPPTQKPNVGFLFVPGLLNGLLPVRAFSECMVKVSEMTGVKFLRADCHPLRSSEDNVADIMRAINEGRGLLADTTFTEGDGKRPFENFVCMGYSKGAPDILTAMANEPEFRRRCRAMIGWVGAIGGSYAADDIFAQLQSYDTEWWTQNIDTILGKICPILGAEKPRRFEESKIKEAVECLVTYNRSAFNRTHQALWDDLRLPIFHFTGSCTPDEVPYFQVQSAIALTFYDNNNDMQLTEPQAMLGESPYSQHTARLHANHWDVSYPKFPAGMKLGSSKLEHPFPRWAALAAHVMMMNELGLLYVDEEEEKDVVVVAAAAAAAEEEKEVVAVVEGEKLVEVEEAKEGETSLAA